MTGAIEFLQKAKAINDSCKHDETLTCGKCPIAHICGAALDENEADLVRKVMNYQIEDSKQN